MKISAVIITLNEAENIERCINSVKDVADEILVFDSGSTDNTKVLAENSGAKVIDIDWEGYAATKNKAIALASFDYILSLDADEALSEELAGHIKKGKPTLSKAYSFNRLNNYCGKWIKHGGFYPDKKVRLFNRNSARWKGDFVHETLEIDNNVEIKHLKGDLLHYSYVSIEDHLKRAHKYAELAAQRMAAEGKGKFANVIINPLFRFFKTYFLKAGFLDGKYGLYLSGITAYEVYLKYAKAVGLSGKK